MKRLLWIFMVIGVVSGNVFGDSWVQPVERDYYCNSKQFVAHVTPPTHLQKTESLLEVFEISNDQRTLIWQCKLGNELAPHKIYISDDGKHVATLNEHGKIGYGNFVLAFYNEAGLIKNYSLEEMPHISKVNQRGLYRLMSHSTTSRWWNENSIQFFHTHQGNPYFCMWWPLFDQWFVWNPADGELCQIMEDMIKGLNDKARSWSIKQLEIPYPTHAPYEFLCHLKRPEDRHYIEAMLSSTSYMAGGATSRSFRREDREANNEHRLMEIIDYTASSTNRMLAERLLNQWDQRPAKQLTPDDFISNAEKTNRNRQKRVQRYLGTVKGTLKLPKPNNDENTLMLNGVISIYLVPEGTPKTKWNESPIVHRLRADFNSHYEGATRYVLLTENFPFNLQTVTPGKYWIKAVWDKSRPSSFYSGESALIGIPQKGDYQSLSSPTITVTAGETVDNVVIDCTHQHL